MTSQYRHRRTSNPATAFPNPLEPGEIAVNTANRQIAIGDAQSGVVGQPLPAIAVRYFDIRAQYVVNDFVQNGSAIYRAKQATGPGSFTAAHWEMMVGQFDPQYVAKAGDVMTGMLTLPATVPSIGTHATNKTYVDTQVATKSTVYSQISPPAGVPDNTLWFESDSGILYVRYNDGDSTQWVVACPQPDTAQFIIRTGDTMLGQLGLPLTPTAAAHATSKSYVDGQLANKSSVISSDTPPPAPIDNTLWFESDTGLTYLRYNDGNGPAQWIGIADSGMGALRYDFAQTLTPNAMAQARANAGVTKKNYVINGAMMISQENGATAGTTTQFYPVDQFRMSFSNTAVQTFQQVASATPGGSPNRIRLTATAGDAALAAGDLCIIVHDMEGLRTADLRLGSAAAKTITIQFGVKAPAGTYCVAITNGASNRAYIAEYIIAGGEANTDVVKSVTIVLDQTGTWPVDNTKSMLVTWTLMAGATYQTPANAWVGGSFFCASPAQSNFLNTTGNVFELFDVSLTEGATAPPFAVPDYASELALCKRYWQKLGGTGSDIYIRGNTSGGAALIHTLSYSEMRAAPAAVKAGTWTISPNAAGQPTVASPGLTSVSLQLIASTSNDTYTIAVGTTCFITLNARL